MTAGFQPAPARGALGGIPFLYNLQTLRAYAALCVFMVHLCSWNPGTGVCHGGVDLFFVLSGFLMTHLCFTAPESFLARRIIRIVPMYWLFTLAVFGLAVLAPGWLHTTSPNVPNLIRSLLFIPYQKEPGVIAPVLFLGWTLNYEMYFYIIYGLAMLGFKRSAPRITALFIALPPAVGMLWPPAGILASFYADPIAVEFAYGIGIYCWLDRAAPGKAGGGPMAGLWLALLALPLLEWRLGLTHRVLTLGLAAAVAVFLAVRLELGGQRVCPPAVLAVGNASYVLYLSHPYVLQVGEKVFQAHRLTTWPARLGAGVLLGAAALSLALVLHQRIEIPVQRFLRRRLAPGGG